MMKTAMILKKQRLLNTYVNNITMSEAISAVDQMIQEGKKSYIVAINVDVVMKIEQDDYLRQISDKADLTIVDGKPLIWISHWHHRPVKEKISGSDLVPELCALSAKKGYTVYILGGKEGVADQARNNLERKYNGIQIVGTYAPPLGFEHDPKECEHISRLIRRAHPDLLIVCFGCPKQEKWVYENYKTCGSTVCICAGATVDFLAGNVKRAPKWMSDHGFEWLYRFFKEPKRMFSRYFVDDVKILKLIKKYK